MPVQIPAVRGDRQHVMPTGSGKSAVMMAAAIVLRAQRVLVVAPNKLLREQLMKNFVTLEPLRRLGAVDAANLSLRVCEVEHKLGTAKSWTSLKAYDVVIGTPMVLSPEIEGVSAPEPDLFDVILFHEAHHVPAPTYTAIAAAFPRARKVLFTATPFRRDDKEIPGDLIFTYELARAMRDGVYGRLQFVPVNAPNGDDAAIAAAAAARLRSDRKQGFDHRLVVRAETKRRANDLDKLYKKTRLKLRRVHSGLGVRTVDKTIQDLIAGTIDGVIAVDMLGEGFDLPNLKVAALHTPHNSLAVTLQFIGRFARTAGTNLGPASFFAIPGEVTGEAQHLYVPGAEWNEIVADLSRDRIDVEKETRRVIAGFSPVSGLEAPDLDEEVIRSLLWSLRPFIHAKVYDVFGAVISTYL